MKFIATLLLIFNCYLSFTQTPDLIPYRKGDIWGYVNSAKAEKISFKYEDASKFNDLDLAIVKSAGKYGVINKEAKLIFPFEFDEITFNTELGIAKVKKDDKWNLYSKSGKRLLARWFDDVRWVSEGLVAVRADRGPEDARIEKWGFADRTGRVVINTMYETVSDFHNGLACVQLQGKFGYLNKAGKEAIEIKFVGAKSFNDSLAPAALPQLGMEVHGAPAMKWGFINTKGESVIAKKYNRVWYFFEGFAPVEINGYFAYINKKGEQITQFEYLAARDFYNGYAMVMKKEELGPPVWGYIDTKGEEIMKPAYSFARNFNENLAAVKLLNDWGYVDTTGATIVPFKFYSAGDFTEGLAPVKTRKLRKWGYIDKTGTEVIPVKYDVANNFSGGLALVQYKGKWGYIDQKGNEYWED